MNIGKAIRKARKSQGLTQGEFAEAVGRTQTHISQLELGHNKPSYNLLDKISTQFQIPVPVLFWLAIEEEDIREDKKASYNMMKPSIDAMINSLI
jgi:transcriptional regulator with XRE-family HTH domain